MERERREQERKILAKQKLEQELKEKKRLAEQEKRL